MTYFHVIQLTNKLAVLSCSSAFSQVHASVIAFLVFVDQKSARYVADTFDSHSQTSCTCHNAAGQWATFDESDYEEPIKNNSWLFCPVLFSYIAPPQWLNVMQGKRTPCSDALGPLCSWCRLASFQVRNSFIHFVCCPNASFSQLESVSLLLIFWTELWILLYGSNVSSCRDICQPSLVPSG